MLEQLKTFAGLVLAVICVCIGFMAVGWWMLVPAVAGALWTLAGSISREKSGAPSPASAVASSTSKPASTTTWQETVEAIERSRKP